MNAFKIALNSRGSKGLLRRKRLDNKLIKILPTLNHLAQNFIVNA
jgi:hypothetical protein